MATNINIDGLGKVKLNFKLTEREYERFKKLIETDSVLWDKIRNQYGCVKLK